MTRRRKRSRDTPQRRRNRVRRLVGWRGAAAPPFAPVAPPPPPPRTGLPLPIQPRSVQDLPEPGALDSLPPRERRALGQFGRRMETERLNWRYVRNKSAVRWGSPTFDALFRAALGFWMGSIAGALAGGFVFRGATDSLRHEVLAVGYFSLPLVTIIGLAFHWRRKFEIRQHVLKGGVVAGFLFSFLGWVIL